MSKEIIILPPTITEVADLPLVSDLQFLEVATSEALNRKMLGVVNPGIRRGFTYKLGKGLSLIIGDDSGKNTACVERDNVLLTIQGQHAVTLNIPAGKESAIVIEAFYQYGVATKQVDINSDIDAAQLLVVDSNKTLDHHVILYDVIVPIGATQITDEMISDHRRKEASLDIESHVAEADPHTQYVKKTFHLATESPLQGGKSLDGDEMLLSIDRASTTQEGVVQLIDSYTSDSQVLAPTANALRMVHQKATDAMNKAVDHWNYTAKGNEEAISLPYAVSAVDSVIIQGVYQIKDKAWNFNADANVVMLAEPLMKGDEIIITLGTPSNDASVIIAELQDRINQLEAIINAGGSGEGGGSEGGNDKQLEIYNGQFIATSNTFRIPSSFRERHIKILFLQGVQQAENSSYTVNQSSGLIEFITPIDKGTAITLVG
ncbi:phage tail protein (plasmid) [Photobacterium leiognathi subsp. mandapamensis]|uniref:phage tail protein n=1 Tax=Photobacterium leiognathi TaxID=553611 RepID=UPI003AF3AC67